MKLNLAELDCIFLSYDEPNAEYNYADLLNKAPWAKRVHGVKGSDAAHKACANLSETDHFITVDADNIVDSRFFELVIDTDKLIKKENTQLSWSGKNIINGLEYGNGGLKCWTKQHVLEMRSHEVSTTAQSQVDFCWQNNYVRINNSYSTVYNNADPLQAWRAGFREGVKLSLKYGLKQDTFQLDEINLRRMLMWCSVGTDVKNGAWAIYGARLGCYLSNCTDWDFLQVRDFDYLNNLFEQHKDLDPLDAAYKLGDQLRQQLNLPVADLNDSQSKFFKTVWTNPPRTPTALDESEILWHNDFDIIFISYDESNAEDNWKKVLGRAPTAQRIHGVEGIFAAHKAAAQLARTEMFWVVDGDADLTDNWLFDYYPSDAANRKKIHVWKSRNPINDLEYGYGGIKLFPRKILLDATVSSVDVTTGLGSIRVMPYVSNVTAFNTDPYTTWRSAFRECAKLSAGIINNHKEKDTATRLHTWTTHGIDKPFGEYAIAGALAGAAFGSKNKSNEVMMRNINNRQWLKEQFDAYYR